jgi:hypothetical protein
VPRAFEDEGELWPDRAERAQGALAKLEDGGLSEQQWKQRAKDNSEVPTTLVAFDKEVTAQLLHHAYVLAMVNLHVILGYPLCDVPALERFQELAS